MKSVAIVAMGASHSDYTGEASMANSRYQVADEIWAINAMGDVIKHDRLFIMDDLRVFVKRMADTKPWYTQWMMKHDKPIITSVDYPEFPSSEAYPLEQVVNNLSNPHYYNSTVAYAVALAIVEKFDKIRLYGADFTYENQNRAEGGRGCVEFLLGIAHARGIQIEMAHSTTLLDQHVPKEHKFYGFIHQPTVQNDGEQFSVRTNGGVDYDEIGEVDFVYGRYALRKRE